MRSSQRLSQECRDVIIETITKTGGHLASNLGVVELTNIVHVKPERLIVVLNDNGWSISENVGWMVHWRNRFELHPAYGKLVEKGHRFVKRLPHGDKAWELARKLKSSVEGLFLPISSGTSSGFTTSVRWTGTTSRSSRTRTNAPGRSRPTGRP
jgi:deoxyxylulose-5-phosphate synthase